MTDHTAGRCTVGYGSAGFGQVVAADAVGLCGDSREEGVDVRVIVMAVEVWSVGWAAVEVGGGLGEEVGESGGTGRVLVGWRRLR